MVLTSSKEWTRVGIGRKVCLAWRDGGRRGVVRSHAEIVEVVRETSFKMDRHGECCDRGDCPEVRRCTDEVTDATCGESWGVEVGCNEKR